MGEGVGVGLLLGSKFGFSIGVGWRGMRGGQEFKR
jgi:hypothetical protein